MAVSQDDLLEIFSWLPAKAIHKFKCAGKLFSKFPEDSYFALKQAQNSLTKNDPCFFIQQDFGHTELHSLPGREPSSSGVPDKVLGFLSKSAKILASNNGLILCRNINQNQQVELFVSNPATQSILPIPTPKHLQESIYADLKVVLECGSSDYKVLLFDGPTDWGSSLDCNVYSHKEGVWKTRGASFPTGGRDLRFDMPVHCNGSIHFISDCYPYFAKRSPFFGPYIMAYNLENGASEMLRVPKGARRGSHDESCDMRIFKWGKVTSSTQTICLVRLRKSVFTIWILDKYESSSWRRTLKVRVKGMGLPEQQPVIAGFTVLNGDLLVLATEKKVYAYGLTNDKYMKVEEICQHECESKVNFVPYSDTLRSCGNGAKTLPLMSIGHLNEEPSATTSNVRAICLISLQEQEHHAFLSGFYSYFCFYFCLCLAVFFFSFVKLIVYSN